ncbi:hypothetical protein GOODEAATRI_022666 [Goodea atripinnis]|uniref:Secreted protein n=1 Tax=Goodea atripinnis TaxID=208336 RepID=A0ABV0P704_9TELE
MLWSRWPCMAIITSASSNTNIVIFLGSISLYLVHQSRTVPGVPMTICSCNLTPRSTEHKHQQSCRENTPPVPDNYKEQINTSDLTFQNTLHLLYPPEAKKSFD